MRLRRFFAMGLWVLVVVLPGYAACATKYPPLSAYLMPRDAEISLARSAAPPGVAVHATVKVLTESGYQTVVEGTNDFICVVERGFSGPTFTPVNFRDFVYDATLRAPICFNPVAARTVYVYQELRTSLAMQGKTPDEITTAVAAAYATGKLPKMETVGFAYMLSADMYLGARFGHYHPHIMVYAPYYTNDMLGGNSPDSMQMMISDDAGTPFSVVVIPVSESLANHAAVTTH